MSTYSEACCQIPPVVAEGYEPKGKYVTLNDMKTYVSGPTEAKHALFVIYDIFGFFPQTLQGADILAYSDKERPYHVFMPDFLDGEPADISWYPPDTKEKEEKLGNFFQTKADPKLHLPKIKDCVAEALKKFPQIESWGILGYCWGAKIASIVAGTQTKFKAAALLHPAMLDPADGAKVQIPMCLLASGDESPDDVKKYSDNLTVKKHVETFDTQIHGWMAARADLKDPAVLKEYERGYKTLVQFFHENL